MPPLTGLLKGYLVKLPSNRNELSVEQIINKLIFFSPLEICQFESEIKILQKLSS